MKESIAFPHLLLLISICLGGLVDRNIAQSSDRLNNFSALSSLTFDNNQPIEIKRANTSSQRLEETSNAVLSQSLNSEANSTHTVNVPYRTQYLVLTANWENHSEVAQIQLIDPEGNIIPESDFEQYDIKLAFDSDEMREYSSSSSRSKSAHIRNPQWGAWQIQIVNPTNLGEISYGKQDGIVGRIVPEMDILPGIEQIDESKFKISYEIEDPDSDDIRVDFYADINQEGYNGLSIDRPIASIPVSKGRGSYILDTEGFAPGEYYIYAEANDNFARKKSYIDGLSNYSAEKITLVREADISASITADTDEIYIGDTITYTVTATNESDKFDSRGVKMLVNLPENLEIISTSQISVEPESGFQEAASNLIFDLGTLLPKETRSVNVTVKALADNDSTLNSFGTASVFLQSQTYDPNPNNSEYNSGENLLDVDINLPSTINAPKPFLTLERIDPDIKNLQVDLNTRYSYDIVITNTGDAVATGVTIEENIDGLDGQLNRVTTTQGNYAYNRYSDIIIANLGSIAPGETATVTVEVTAQAAGKRYTSSILEYNEKQVVDEITTTTTVEPIPVPAADLELTQTIDNLNPLVGEQVNITLNLVNQGPGIASGIEVTNLLPEGLKFVRANAALGSYNPTTGIWNAGNIRDGVRTSLTITALVEDAGSITNQAEITFTDQKDSDSTPGNGDPTEDDFAAVTIESAFPNTAPTSSNLIVASSPVILAQNTNVAEFEQTFEVQSNVETIILNARWSNTANPNQISIRLLTPDGNIIEEIDFDKYDNISIAEPFTNENRKSVVVANPSSGNWGIEIVDKTGLEDVETGIYRQIRNIDPTLEILDVTQNADGSEVTIVYEARDPDTAAKFDLYYQTDNGGYDFFESKTIVSDLNEDDGKGTYVWNTEGVAPGKYYIGGQIKGQHGICTFDSNYSSNPIEIATEADISANVVSNVSEVIVGEEITYTATVSNTSNKFESRNVQLSFGVPEGASLISTSHPIAYSGDEKGGDPKTKIFEKIERLAPGEEYEIEIIVSAPDQSTPSTSASVYLISDTYDPNSDNNRDDVYISVDEPPKTKPLLTLERIDPDLENLQVDLNTRYSYDIVITNTGDAVATGVTIEENIDGLDGQLNRVTTTQGNYAYNRYSDIITANLGSIAPGETATVTVEVTAQAAGKRYTSSTLEYKEKQVADEITTTTTVEPIPVPAADLELTQTIDNLNPLVGKQVNITLNLVNQGPGIASGIEVTNLLPEGLNFVRANAGLGNYNSTTGIWNAGNIRDGVRTSLTITALVEDAGSITNQAEITFTDQKDSDSTPGNGDPTEDDFAAVTIESAFPNTAPTTSGIDSFVVTKNAPDITLSLFDVFDDAEDADSDLIYRLVSNTNSDLFDSIELNDESELVLNFADDYILGRADISVSATDPYGESVSADFMVSVVDSGKGKDIIYGDLGNDYLYGDKKEDYLSGLAGDDTLIGDKGKDTLIGGIGNDYLEGGKDKDLLMGDAGDDALIGGHGTDILIGGIGNDYLEGGKDKDLFVLAIGEGIDTIADFENKKDLLGLSNGLTFGQLTILQEKENTLVSIASSKEVLAVLNDIDSDSIDQKDFTYMT